MKTEYKRDMNHNFLILYGEQEVDTSSYQVRMLAGNVLPSVLKCRIQRVDGNTLFYYEITSRQSITSLYEEKKFKMEDLQLIFGGFLQAMEEMGEYLLNPGQLVIDPDYVFMDVEKKGLYFCYLPGYDKEVQEQFRSFTEYILPKLDHEDGRAVMLGYGVYRSALEDSFHLEHIKKELYQVREELPAESFSQDFFLEKREKKVDGEKMLQEAVMPDREPKIHENMDWDSPKEWKKKEKEESFQDTKSGFREKIAVIIAAAVSVTVMLGVLAANYLGYLPWLNVEAAMGIGLVLLGCVLLVHLLTRQKKVREQKNWRNEVEKNRKARERQEAILGKTDFQDEKPEAFMEAEPLSGKTGDMERKVFPAEKVDSKVQNVGETVVLSANTLSGPASLVSKEPGELATIYLKEELTVIGKLETACDAVIPYPTVSRVHGKIRKRGEEYFLTDLNSRNGTSVNGRMLKGDEEYMLQEEDEVDFAQARYVFLK